MKFGMTHDIQIRSMTEQDLDLVLNLERRCHSQPWSREVFLQELANEVAAVDLLLIDEVLAGYIVSWLVLGELEIQNVVTAPEHRRRRVAKTLLRHVVTRARERNASRALLEVRAGNEAAIALYENCGFRINARRKGYYHDRETALLMSLDDLSGFDLT